MSAGAPHPYCGERPPRRAKWQWYLKARLRRRLFVAFAAAIFVTGAVVVAVLTTLGAGPTWRDEVRRVEAFTAGRFARSWGDEAARGELADALARDLDVDVTLTDAAGAALLTATPEGRRQAPACARPARTMTVRSDGASVLGHVRVCTARHQDPRGRWNPMVALGAVMVALWGIAGVVARRLTRPLTELVRVVQALGEGRLESRMQLHRHDAGELGAIAHAVNEMAARIERQVDDQRNLLAAVSHEIRSPLARLRFVLEALRDGDPGRERALDEADLELTGVDALVGDLLATSRMDFDALRPVALDAADVAARALERAGLDAALLEVAGEGLRFEGDATLVQTALANVLGNARKHGGRAVALRVSRAGEGVEFAVDDDGPGFAGEELARVFEPFYRGDAARARSGGVGLGLALVRRIAEVHGGGASAENLPGGGARVRVRFGRAATARQGQPGTPVR